MTDSPIRFPGLFGDWAFTASSKAVNVGHGIYWYGILIAAGLLLALAFCMRRRKEYGLKEDDVLDTVLWGIPFGILGARLYYVIFYLDLYKNVDGSFNWGRAVAIWDGGLAIYGTVIAVVIVGVVVSRKRKFPFFALMDLVVMGLMIGQAVGRWGNFMNREAFGVETTLPWRMQLTTVSGSLVEVHPTFLYESLWNVVGLVLIVLVVSKGRRFDGENTAFYFLWYGIGRFWIEGLRTDSLYLFNWQLFGRPIRVSQALSLVMVLVSAFLLFYHIRLRPHSREELYVNRVAAAQQAAAQAGQPAEAPAQTPQQPEETPQQPEETPEQPGETPEQPEEP